MRARYYRMKKSEDGFSGVPKERKSKKQKIKETVDPEPREERIDVDVERPDITEPFGQSVAIASAAPSVHLGLHAMMSEPRVMDVDRPDMTKPAGQSAVVASGVATSIVPKFNEVRAYQQPPVKEPVAPESMDSEPTASEPVEEGIDAERPEITEPLGKYAEVGSGATPSIVPGFHSVLAIQQTPTKEPMDSEPSEGGVGVDGADMMQPVGQSTAVASAIPAIVPGFHTVRAFRQSPTKEHVDDSEPREEGVNAESLDI
jgi:hypothetical protein